jgi:hypothetical protein
MANTLDLYKNYRASLVRFSRTILDGDPDGKSPDVDDRGFETPYRCPVVGVAKGRTVELSLFRQKVGEDAALYVTTSDGSAFTVAEPADGKLSGSFREVFKITGVDCGSDKKEAKLQVRYGSKTGVIVNELAVWVLKELEVDITPHRVVIDGSNGAGATPAANIEDIMKQVADVWIHAGIKFKTGSVVEKTLTLATKDIVSDDPFPGELSTILNTDWVPHTINAYFVVQIGRRSTLGYGFSRPAAQQFHVPNPGIILGDRTASSARSGAMHYANDLAHEIGHFFTLWHPEEKQPPEELEDTWSRRKLMHNYNLMRGPNPWPSTREAAKPGPPPVPAVMDKFRPRSATSGYGTSRRGCMVTLKNLTKLAQDDECTRARSTITSTAGPY